MQSSVFTVCLCIKLTKMPQPSGANVLGWKGSVKRLWVLRNLID